MFTTASKASGGNVLAESKVVPTAIGIVYNSLAPNLNSCYGRGSVKTLPENISPGLDKLFAFAISVHLYPSP